MAWWVGRWMKERSAVPVLVDTYNVLHVTGVLPPELAGVDAWELAGLIRGSRWRHERATLVCDGVEKEGEPAGKREGVTVRYAGAGRTADEVIGLMVARSSDPRRLTVVTSDRAVQREARKRRCPTVTSEAFLEQLAADHEARRAGRVKKARPMIEQPERASAKRRFLPNAMVEEAERLAAEMAAATEAEVRQREEEASAREQRKAEAARAAKEAEEVRRRGKAEEERARLRGALPGELLAEAEALAGGGGEEEEQSAEPSPWGVGDGGTPPDRDESAQGERRGRQLEATLPEDLIAEAEAMLRELEGGGSS